MSEWQVDERCPAPAEVLLAREGELPFARGERVLAHVRHCEACQARLRADDDTVHLHLSDLLRNCFDSDRVGWARQHVFNQLLRAPSHARAIRWRKGWAGRRAMTAAAVLLVAMTGGLVLPAHAESFGAMITRVAAAVREGLGFEAAATSPQQRSLRKTERTPAVPATATTTTPAPAPVEPAETETTREAATQIGTMPDRDTLDQAELDARLVLSDASLDLLRGIRVSSTQRAVRVEGVIPSPRRKIVARLNALPYVRVSLRAGPVTEAGAPGVSEGRMTGLSRWVDYRLGDRPEKQTFVPELTRLTAAVTERVHTLQGLAVRYSDEAVRDLSPAARGKLQKLLDKHYQSLSSDLDALDARLSVLFGSSTRVFPSRHAPADWQQRVNDSVMQAQLLDRSLRDLLSLDDLPPVPPEDDAPAGDRAVTIAFGALWDTVHGGRP